MTAEQDKALARTGSVEQRRRLARRKDLQPELLYFLAGDANVEVRQEVAGNDATPWQADAILVLDQDVDVRSGLGPKLARLLPGLSDTARASVRDRVLKMIEQLARDEAEKVRAALSESIKRLDCVPADIVKILATDMALLVAEPVLRFSPMLGEADLLEIIAGRHARGALGAIASRDPVTAAVADAIAYSSDSAAIATLLANPLAQVREETLDALVERAPGQAEWHGPLVDRPVMPQRLLSRLAAFVAETFIAKLQQRKDLDPKTRVAIAKALGDRNAPVECAAPVPKAEPEEKIELVEDRVRRLRAEGKLDEEAVFEALDKGDRPFVRAAVAALAHTEPETFDRVVSGRSAKGMVALAWRARLGPRLAYQLQLRMGGLSPRQALAPRNGEWPLTADEMVWHLEFFGIADSQLRPVSPGRDR
jgi:uncharacterized protein (DUF2336 family)